MRCQCWAMSYLALVFTIACLTFVCICSAGMEPLTPDEVQTLGRILPSLFVFAVIWSVGASCDKSGRTKFD
eukprot:scaffold95689_cov18-Tisochrysis_lutea.AAC.1